MKLTKQILAKLSECCSGGSSCGGPLVLIHEHAKTTTDTILCACDGHMIMFLQVANDSIDLLVINGEMNRYTTETGTFYLSSARSKKLKIYTDKQASLGSYPEVTKVLPSDVVRITEPIKKWHDSELCLIAASTLRLIYGVKKNYHAGNYYFTHDSVSPKLGSIYSYGDFFCYIMPMRVEAVNTDSSLFDTLMPAPKL